MNRAQCQYPCTNSVAFYTDNIEIGSLDTKRVCKYVDVSIDYSLRFEKCGILIVDVSSSRDEPDLLWKSKSKERACRFEMTTPVHKASWMSSKILRRIAS